MTISVLSFQAISNPPLRLPFSTFNHHRPSRNFFVCSAKPVVPPALKHTAAARIESLSQVSGVLASQWGNEGKENLVEILAPHFDIVAIYQVLLLFLVLGFNGLLLYTFQSFLPLNYVILH